MYRLICFLLLGMTVPAQAQEAAAPLTLAAALQLAEAGNPALSGARHELAAQGGALQQAQALPNPELQTLVEDTRRATRSSTVQLNQLIELGGKRGARATAALRGQDVAQAGLAAQQADTRAQVTTAFVDVLAAQEGLRLADSAQALAARASEITARRVTAGKASPVEATRARVLEASVRLELNLARSTLAQARQRLAALWGGTTPRFTSADGSLDTLPPLPSPLELAGRLEQSPAVRQARSQLAQRQAMLDVEQRRATPDVTVSIGLKRSEELGRNQAIIGLALPLPLFDRNAGNTLKRCAAANRQATSWRPPACSCMRRWRRQACGWPRHASMSKACSAISCPARKARMTRPARDSSSANLPFSMCSTPSAPCCKPKPRPCAR